MKPESATERRGQGQGRVVRGLKNEDSALIEDSPVFHNFIREHGGLDGKTPAEAARLIVEGDNKRVTLIQNASRDACLFPNT
jgi:putative transposase